MLRTPLMRLRLLSPMLLVAVLLAGCGGGSGTKLGSSDVAVVGNEHITLSAYSQALAEERANYKAQGTAFPKAGSTTYQSMQTEIVDTLVQEAEFSAEATKLHLTVTPAAVDAQVTAIVKKQFGGSEAKYLAGVKAQGYTPSEVREAIQERLLELKLFDSVTKGTTVTSAEIASYYAQNLTQYQTAASRQVREILAGKKKSVAETVYALLKAGGSWTTLAKRYSQDPGSKDKGGVFTAKKGSDVPAFDTAVFAANAKTDVLLKPVDTPQYGWFVIEPIGAITAATVEPESKAAKSIRATLTSTAQQQAFEKWITGVAKGFCGGSQISYRAGYSPSPDPCASITTTNQTTT
jgi:parvulin-like peptidyl-prolyl isomerase